MTKRELNDLRDFIEQIFNDSVAGKLEQTAIPIGVLTETGKSFLENLSGLDFKEEVTFCLHPDDLVHIYKNHYGLNENDQSNLISLVGEDIRKIADILYHPDAVAYLGEDKKGKKFVFFLESEVGCFNLIDVYAHRRGKLTVKTYYHTKKGVSQSAMNFLAQTSETYGATLSVANIPILLKSK